MQETLKRLQPLLVTAAQDVQRIMTTVEKESIEVAEIEKVVKVDEEAAMVIKLIAFSSSTLYHATIPTFFF